MKQVIYETGGVKVESKEFTDLPGGKIRLINQNDYQEFLNFSISNLIAIISELSVAINSLRQDIRQIRVGNEAFVYGDKVSESGEVDSEELDTEVQG